MAELYPTYAKDGSNKLHAPRAGDTFIDEPDVSFDNISDLTDYKIGQSPRTKTANVMGYYSAGDGGGGTFYWDANEDKANHNGGTIINPDHNSTIGSDNWYSATGDGTSTTGSGCWVRPDEGFVNVKWFGAKGDGSNDDSHACQAAIDTFHYSVFFPSNNDYLIDNSLELPNDSFIWGHETKVRSKANSSSEGGDYPTVIFKNDDFINGNKNIRFKGIVFWGIKDDPDTTVTDVTSTDNSNPTVRFEEVEGLFFDDCELTQHRTNRVNGTGENREMAAMTLENCSNIFIDGFKFNNSYPEGPIFFYCNDIKLTNLDFNNDITFSSFKLWYCDNVKITSSDFFEDNDTGSIADFCCTNLVIRDTTFKGGTQIDIGNELDEQPFIQKNNIFDNVVVETASNGFWRAANADEFQNLKIINSKVTSSKPINIRNLDGFTEENNELTSTGGEGESAILLKSPFKNVQLGDKSTYKANNAIRFQIPDGNVENITINNATAHIEELGTGSSFSGHSSFLFINCNVSSTPTIRDISIVGDNKVYGAEGGFIYMLVQNGNVDFSGLDVNGNRFKSTDNNNCERPFYLIDCADIKCKNNEFYNSDNFRLDECENLTFVGNSFDTNQSAISNIIQLNSCTGKFIAERNKALVEPTSEFFGTDGSNSFDYVILRDNNPNTAEVDASNEKSTFSDGDKTPLVDNGATIYKTGNTSSTEIDGLDGGYLGQRVLVMIDDGNTTVDFANTGSFNNLIGNGGAIWNPSQGDSMSCIFDGDNWHCDVNDNTA